MDAIMKLPHYYRIRILEGSKRFGLRWTLEREPWAGSWSLGHTLTQKWRNLCVTCCWPTSIGIDHSVFLFKIPKRFTIGNCKIVWPTSPPIVYILVPSYCLNMAHSLQTSSTRENVLNSSFVWQLCLRLYKSTVCVCGSRPWVGIDLSDCIHWKYTLDIFENIFLDQCETWSERLLGAIALRITDTFDKILF